MFNPSRNEVREFFFAIWSKAQAGSVLTPLEAMALSVVQAHPEYHEVLSNPERYREREWTPEGGETNPFLHLSVHLAIEEQLSIDQPPGIRGIVQSLESKLGNAMDARHAVMDCLVEQIWQAQRNAVPFNNEAYLDCLRRRSSG
ncbi:hypothetical protein DSM104443_02722 [Usitatibacter rugosus]|uniref:DUF1841 family protein n=1 Tax=Usitatibacter rugosus TaxID=2732067 RepID=A0A6M4GZ02_9PROT|nr:DUF1841 family protein [Usitatibacter rugosus]QJR11643.1 hypothetical protein DSM104443_02722 [Usitatibacter rugosus]